MYISPMVDWAGMSRISLRWRELSNTVVTYLMSWQAYVWDGYMAVAAVSGLFSHVSLRLLMKV